jgi:hypothetical protein
MARTIGTYSLEDLLAQRFVPASEFGFDQIARAIQAHLDWLNGQVADQMGMIAETTDDVRRIWGGSEDGEMVEVDETGVARTQKDEMGEEIDFPLRKFSRSTGWTADYMNRATPADLATKVLKFETAYVTRLRQELAAALFAKANYSFVDWLGDGTTLAIKRLKNADSMKVPNAPDGTAFAATHQHYTGYLSGSAQNADIDALIANVTEHGFTNVQLIVNQANVATLAAMTTTKFVPLTLAVVAVPGRTSGTVQTDVVTEDPANKLVGYWAGYPVITRSWVPSGYYVANAVDAPQKPLVHRVDKFASMRGLRLVAQFGQHPLSAQTYEAEVGFGVWGRTSAAILDGGNATTYSNPSGLVRTR